VLHKRRHADYNVSIKFDHGRDHPVLTKLITRRQTRQRQPTKAELGRVVDRREFGLGVLAAGSAFATTHIKSAFALTSQPKEPRRVFAHYMVCCPMGGEHAPVDDYIKEIRQAQSHGIDGFALNCGSWTEQPRYRAIATRIFAAAATLGTGFKLFFSADWLSPDQVVAMVSEFYEHPNMLHFAKKPVLSTFGGYEEWAQAFLRPLATAGKPVFFVPFFFPHDLIGRFTGRFTDSNLAQLIADNDFVDGYFFFGAGGSGDGIANTSIKVGQAWRRAGKLYMAPVSPYYRGLGGNYRVFETRGFEGMAREWEAAIVADAQWVEIVTWNDWGESTYVADRGSPNVWDAHKGNLLSHAAYLAASEYYIRWFKTGVQRINRDDLYWFYRLSPRKKSGISNIENKTEGFPSGVENLEDRLFLTVFLIAPAQVDVESGDRRYHFPLSAGVHHLSADFALGLQKFRVEREGRTILTGQGAFPVSDDNWANFNYLSGQAGRI